MRHTSFIKNLIVMYSFKIPRLSFDLIFFFQILQIHWTLSSILCILLKNYKFWVESYLLILICQRCVHEHCTKGMQYTIFTRNSQFLGKDLLEEGYFIRWKYSAINYSFLYTTARLHDYLRIWELGASSLLQRHQDHYEFQSKAQRLFNFSIPAFESAKIEKVQY